MADVMTFPLDPTAFAEGIQSLQAPNGSYKTDVTMKDQNTGSVASSLLDFDYSYNGTDTLSITITAKHGMAKFAPTNTIKSHIQELLAKV